MPNQFIGSTEEEQAQMLIELGIDPSAGVEAAIQKLYDQRVPPGHQFSGNLPILGNAISEFEVRKLIASLAGQNIDFNPSAMFLGAGHYSRIIPTAVGRITGNGKWETPYTPYQPEIAGGILLAISEFEAYVSAISGMPIANAGTYHGSNSLAEAALMACRITENTKILVSDAIHPNALLNLQTYFAPKAFEIEIVPTTLGTTTAKSIEERVDSNTAAVIIQNPNFYGLLDGMQGQSSAIHNGKTLFISYGGGDQMSLVISKTPAEYGADIYAAEFQHFGLELGLGGPHVGALAIKDPRPRGHIRQMPGRLVIKTKDLLGNDANVLGIQRREQHISRDKATSNACTTQTLMSVQGVVYFAIMGPQGLDQAANQSYHLAHYVANEFSQIPGFENVHNQPFFNEFLVKTPIAAYYIVDDMARQGILSGVPLSRAFPNVGFDPHLMLVAVTEINNDAAIITTMINGMKRYATTRPAP